MPMALFLGVMVCALGLHWGEACQSCRPAQAEPVSIEIYTQTGHIVMPVWIEGEGPYWFVLDTGNQNTTMFAHLAEQLGIESKPLGEMGGAGAGSISVQMASDVHVGLGEDGEQLGFVDEVVTILPDSAILPPFGDKTIAGFLGATTIERFITSIDYEDNELVFTPHDQYTMPQGARVMELDLAFGFPYFEGSVVPVVNGEAVDAIRGSFLLDLGDSNGISIGFEQAKGAGLIDSDDPAQRILGRGQGIDGVQFELRVAPAESIVMGGMKMSDREISFSMTPGGGPPIPNLVGNVGSGSFVGSTVTLDYQGGRLILE